MPTYNYPSMPVPGNISVFGIKIPDFGIIGNGGSPYLSGSYNGASAQTQPSYSGGDFSPYVPFEQGVAQLSGGGVSGGGSGGGGVSGGGSVGGEPINIGPTNEELNSVYDPMMNTLNAQEGALRGNEQNYYNTATAPYTSQIPLVEQAGQQGQNAITGQQNTAGVQEQNALAAARRLYDELTSRNRQAFGSGALGSVGQAAGEILVRTAMQGIGGIRNAGAETMQKLYTAARDLQEKTTAQINSLTMQKDAALAQAKTWFSDKLMEITSAKNEVESQKADRKLQALQDYRDYVRQLAQNAEQLKSQIVLTAQANGQNIQQAIQQYNTGMSNTIVGGEQNVAGQNQSNALSYADMGQGNQMSAAAPESTLENQGVYAGAVPTAQKKRTDIFA